MVEETKPYPYPKRGKDKKKRNLTPIYKYHLLHNKDYLDLGDVDKTNFKYNIESMECITRGDYTRLTKKLSVMINLPQNQEIRKNRDKEEWEAIVKIMEGIECL